MERLDRTASKRHFCNPSLLKAGTFLIELRNISKTYAKSGTKAVDSLTLQIPDGVIYGFLSPNGAGKTTTIRVMTGAIAADSGSVTIDGIDLDKNPIEAKQRFGLVHDTPDLFSRLRAYEYLNFVADVYRVPSVDRTLAIEKLAAAGGTVFFSTHVMEVAEKICDELAIINKGKLILRAISRL